MKKGLALLTIAGICAYELLAKRRQNLPQSEALLQPSERAALPAPAQEQPQKSERCYYLKNSAVWHTAASCRYIAGKSGVTKGTVEDAQAAGKVRPCALCGE